MKRGKMNRIHPGSIRGILSPARNAPTAFSVDSAACRRLMWWTFALVASFASSVGATTDCTISLDCPQIPPTAKAFCLQADGAKSAGTCGTLDLPGVTADFEIFAPDHHEICNLPVPAGPGFFVEADSAAAAAAPSASSSDSDSSSASSTGGSEGGHRGPFFPSPAPLPEVPGPLRPTLKEGGEAEVGVPAVFAVPNTSTYTRCVGATILHSRSLVGGRPAPSAAETSNRVYNNGLSNVTSNPSVSRSPTPYNITFAVINADSLVIVALATNCNHSRPFDKDLFERQMAELEQCFKTSGGEYTTCWEQWLDFWGNTSSLQPVSPLEAEIYTAMLSVDRIIEFNDTAGNGKFDQSADTVLSYYGAKLYNQSSLLTPKQHAVHAANGDDVGDIAWHGGFAWDHVQSSVQYASPDAATDPTAEPQLDVVMVNITTLPPHAHASRFAPVGKVGLLSVEIIQEAQADDKKVEILPTPPTALKINLFINDYPYTSSSQSSSLLGICHRPSTGGGGGGGAGILPAPSPSPSPSPFLRPQNWCEPSVRIAVQTRSVSRVVRDNVVEEASFIPHARNVAVLMPFAKLLPSGEKELVELGVEDEDGDPEAYLTAYFAWNNKAHFSTADPKKTDDFQERAALVQTVCESGELVRPCSTSEFSAFHDPNSTSTALAQAWCNFTSSSSSSDVRCDVLGSILTVATEGEPAGVYLGTAFGISAVVPTYDSLFLAPYIILACVVPTGAVLGITAHVMHRRALVRRKKEDIERTVERLREVSNATQRRGIDPALTQQLLEQTLDGDLADFD